MAEEAPYTIAELEAEPVIDVKSFDNEDAVTLGETVLAVIREKGLNLAVDVVVDGDLKYRAKLGQTGEGNNPYLAGKVLTVTATGLSSMLVRRKTEAGESFDLPEGAVGYGGGVPIKVGGKVVGAVATSGLQDWEDHQALIEGVKRYLGA